MTAEPEATGTPEDGTASREHAQLLRVYDRLRVRLDELVADISAPGTKKILKDIRKHTGTAPEQSVANVVSALEEALRQIQLAESEIHQTLHANDGGLMHIDGIDNLPARLQRFLTERGSLEGFSYEVTQDEVRGWMICWKEFTGDGRIRGYGQFYERPYAWLDD